MDSSRDLRTVSKLAALVAVVVSMAAGCGPDCLRVSTCDIRETYCQGTVMEAVACLRGVPLEDPPKVELISEAEYIRRASGGVEQVDPQSGLLTEQRYRAWNRGLASFGLAPVDYDIEDATFDRASEVAAAYFASDRSIVIIDRDGVYDDVNAVELLAHEVVHALRDREQAVDYGEQWANSFDASLALDAIIEGEAEHYALLIRLQALGVEPGAADFREFYDQWRTAVLLEAEADDAPVAIASMRFPYAFGGALVSQYWLARGHDGVEDLFAAPPHTTSEVLFGTDQARLASAREALWDHAVPTLPENFDGAYTTALGAWIARIYAARAALEVPARLTRARELAADVMSVQYDPLGDALVASWRVRTLEPEQSDAWPEAPTRSISRLPFAKLGEVADVVGDPKLPVDAGDLKWQAPVTESNGDDEDAATHAGARPWQVPGWVPHHACRTSRRVP